mmetsp:Transcript_36266/g.115548  ORF Transcript_36266/g.115548 Transcript_36266/m.115548 type:complete len:314 (-) Transcript_36266:845-1786(-)
MHAQLHAVRLHPWGLHSRWKHALWLHARWLHAWWLHVHPWWLHAGRRHAVRRSHVLRRQAVLRHAGWWHARMGPLHSPRRSMHPLHPLHRHAIRRRPMLPHRRSHRWRHTVLSWGAMLHARRWRHAWRRHAWLLRARRRHAVLLHAERRGRRAHALLLHTVLHDLWRHALLLRAVHARRQSGRRSPFLPRRRRARLHLLGLPMHLEHRLLLLHLMRERLLKFAQLVGMDLLQLRHVGVLLRTTLPKLELLQLQLMLLVELEELLRGRRRVWVLRCLQSHLHTLALHLGRARLLCLSLSLLFLMVPRVLLLLLL